MHAHRLADDANLHQTLPVVGQFLLMVKIFGPLLSHHASGKLTAPKIYSSSLRNRHHRDAAPKGGPPRLYSLKFINERNPCFAPTINHANQSPGTIETWLRLHTTAGNLAGTLITDPWAGSAIYWFGPDIYAYAQCNERFLLVTLANPVPINAWAHVAMTWSDTLLTLWVNGTEIANSPDTPLDTDIAPSFQLGGKIQDFGDPFQGYICRLRFSDIVRYNANFTPAIDFTPDANTIALWRMTEGTGTTVADESGNNHTLQLPDVDPPLWSNQTP